MTDGLEVELTGRVGALALEVRLHARAGAITALVGPSGAGKSTVLRALAGLHRLDGRVRVGAETWQDAGRFVAPHRRAVGLVFQHAALLPHLSVRGNLHYGWRRARRSAAELDAAVALLRLEPLLDRTPQGLSGGERQRVAVARALATGPALMLLDEPLSGLDADTKRALLPELRRVLSGLAAPVIWVSHDAEEVAAVADRVLVLRDGRVAETDAADAADPLRGMAASEVRRLAAAALAAGLG